MLPRRRPGFRFPSFSRSPAEIWHVAASPARFSEPGIPRASGRWHNPHGEGGTGRNAECEDDPAINTFAGRLDTGQSSPNSWPCRRHSTPRARG
jgi:hypothetical protein